MAQARVDISKNAEEFLDLANKVYQQHLRLGSSSPLQALDWNSLGLTIPVALDQHNKAEEHQKISEAAYERRNNLVAPLDKIVRQSRDILKAIYKDEPKKLGEFGFDVVDSTKTNKKKNIDS